MKEYAVVFVAENVYVISEEKYHYPSLVCPYPVYGFIIVHNGGKGVGVTFELIDKEAFGEELLHKLAQTAINDFMS